MTRRLRRDSFEDVFGQMQNFFEQFQEMGKDLGQNIIGMVPVDIREEGDDIVISADLPGVSKEEINLKADEETVQISAESSQELQEENEKYIRRERSSRQFHRTVSWPEEIDPETIHAHFEDGVLEVRAERVEGSGRDIEIQ